MRHALNIPGRRSSRLAAGAHGPSSGPNDMQKRFSDFRLAQRGEETGGTGRNDWGGWASAIRRGLRREQSALVTGTLDAIETLRRVWLQHYHASEQGTPWRADGEVPPSAVLITSPYDTEARYSRKKSTAWTGYKNPFHARPVKQMPRI